MKKKILALLLSVAMILSLAACDGGGQESSSSTAEGNSSSEGETSDVSASEDPVQAAIDARTEPVTLNVYAGVGTQDAMAEVSAAMSDITREKLNIEVNLQWIDYAAYKQTLTLALTGGEQIDLFTNADTYAATVSNGYALNMDDNGLLDTYGSGIKEVVDEKFLNALRIDGSVYGITSMRDIAKGQFALAVGAQYLDGINYEYTDDEVIYVEAEEFDNIMAQLHEAYPDKNVTTSASLIQNIQYDQLGGDNFGVLLDPLNSLTVEDFFSSDLYYNYCKMFYDWNQAGYISQDAMTSDTGSSAQVQAGTLMTYLCATKPGMKTQESSACGQEMVIFQAGED